MGRAEAVADKISPTSLTNYQKGCTKFNQIFLSNLHKARVRGESTYQQGSATTRRSQKPANTLAISNKLTW